MSLPRVFAPFLALALLPGAVQDGNGQPRKGKCDLGKVEKTPYCPACRAFDPGADEKGGCAGCAGAIEKVDACIKTVSECASCGGTGSAEDPCCENPNPVETTVKSRVLCRCAGCGAEGKTEGACSKPKCREAGSRFLRTCEKSGTWPHGGERGR